MKKKIKKTKNKTKTNKKEKEKKQNKQQPDLVKEYDRKNVIFMRYGNQILPFKFEITKAYFQKLSEKNDQNFQGSLFDLIFPTSMTTYRYFIERSQAYWSQRWLLVTGQNISKLLGNVNIFLCPEMYQNKNRSFTKKLKEIGKIDVKPSMLQIIRT